MSLLKAFTTRNVGTLDRVIRTFPTVIVAYLYFAGLISGWIGLILGVLALMLLLTSILGSCSIYYFLGFSTCPLSKKSKPRSFK
jgi:ABC-type phosphate/phosphonate transport system permease subunit